MGLALFLFSLTNLLVHLVYSDPLCHDDEQSALMQFKHSFIIDMHASGGSLAYPMVEKWKIEGEQGDCCSWDGVMCDNSTGHVIGLDLSSNYLSGYLSSNSSLFQLVYISHLNLANNNFNHSPIPSMFGQLSQLTYLNLSSSVFSGQIPSGISQLSNLSLLDLSNNDGLVLRKPNLETLVQNLTDLQHLDLGFVEISSKVPDTLANLASLESLVLTECGLSGQLPQFNSSSPLQRVILEHTSFSGEVPASIGELKSLEEFNIYNCSFSGYVPSSFGNLTEMSILDFTENMFDRHNPSTLSWLGKLTKLTLLGLNGISIDGEIPSYLANLTQVSALGLYRCQLFGHIPPWFTNLNKLMTLVLSNNGLQGPIPDWIGQLTQLTNLQLNHNNLQGKIPSSISQLKNLEILDLANNNLSGTVELDMFLRLEKLSILRLSENEISLLYESNTNESIRKFSLLELGSCNLQHFPGFLRDQDKLYWLNLGNNNIHGQVPVWVWNATKDTLNTLDLSLNFLTGIEQYPIGFPWAQATFIDLSYNMFQGSLPIPPPFIQIYLIPGNNLTGQLSSELCSFSSLNKFDVSYNNLVGKLPQCLGSFSTSLQALILEGNNFHGEIPDTHTEECNLKVLELGQNKLRGELPRSLANCSKLESLILDRNEIEDAFPSWLGALQELKVLILRSNLFHGVLESHKTNLVFPKLQIIDLSQNNFTGQLPAEYFVNWNAMKVAKSDSGSYWEEYLYTEFISGGFITVFTYSLSLTNKGIKTEFQKMFRYFVAIDLSRNRFEGQIPQSLGDLNGLHLLNLSNNILTGRIPSCLANLSKLEALDVSENKLSGEIPQELAQLTFLSSFNVSHNHLTGPIPHGNQFDTFQNNSYIGNSGLCGGPLSKKCESPPQHSISEEDDQQEGSPLKFGWTPVAIGYASGFGFGIGIGHMIYTKKREWIVKVFGEKRLMRRVVRGIGHWN